ncbi:MAG: nitroreductase family protein, partial [Candidatus Binatia bacterium]
ASLLLLLAIVEEGLGATFVGAFDDAEVTRILGLPDDVQPVAILPVGVAAEAPRPLRRRKPAEVLRRERW